MKAAIAFAALAIVKTEVSDTNWGTSSYELAEYHLQPCTDLRTGDSDQPGQLLHPIPASARRNSASAGSSRHLRSTGVSSKSKIAAALLAQLAQLV